MNIDTIILSDCQTYLQYIVTPITPYLICNHHFSTEIYKSNPKYIGIDITQNELHTQRNDLYANHNYDVVKEGDIIQVQVDLFEYFITNILPKISCKVILFTSQWLFPQIFKDENTESIIQNNKIIFWISQNPIYSNNDKYMAFPYGISHKNIDAYMMFMKSNYQKVLEVEQRPILCYNSHFKMHRHLPVNHIRRHPIFKHVNTHIPYRTYLTNILNSRFTISTSGDRDDCYRHYECIGLNSIPISNIAYDEIFQANMMYSTFDGIINIIEKKHNIIPYKIDRNIITIQYWQDIIKQKYKYYLTKNVLSVTS
jgi:hypothetical protein